MVQAVCDALIGKWSISTILEYILIFWSAHKGAYKVGILHHDVSPGNIMFLDSDANKSSGILIDWDLSKPVAAPETNNGIGPRCMTWTVSVPKMVLSYTTSQNHFLQGTWQFMSAALIAQLDTLQCLIDNLESTLYIILWLAIMYSPCSNISAIPTFLDHTLNPQIKQPEDYYTGKLDFLKGRSLLQTTKFIGWPAFDKLIKDLAVPFSAQYELRERQLPDRMEEEKATDNQEQETLAELHRHASKNPSSILGESSCRE